MHRKSFQVIQLEIEVNLFVKIFLLQRNSERSRQVALPIGSGPPLTRSAVNHTTPTAWITALSFSLVLCLDFALDFGSVEGRMPLNP